MKISGYTRISVDIELNRENTSIENQKQIISDYVAEHFPDARLDLYVDRDRSGYTFEQREGYMQLRPKLMSGEYKILIVKDLSRFSRRNGQGLTELETLRDAGCRIISIGDGIDYPTRDEWTLIQIKFLMNEMPVTDTSKKIKAIINSRQKNGKWVCAVPYGYRITNTKEMTYEIDPPAAEVVREIFRLYNNGWGYKKIANHLTDEGIPTPRANEIAFKEAAGQTTKLKCRSDWSIITVCGILSNDFYIGTLRQKKYTRAKINGKDKRLEDDAHIVIENAHTPIVDNRTFAYTQEQLKLRSTSNYRGEKKYSTDYSGFLFCGDCGSPMFSMSRKDLSPAYTCGTYHRRGLKGCTSHHIRVDKLDELLKRYVQVVRDNSASMMERLEAAIKQQPEREAQIGTMIDSLERQLSDSKEQLKTLYKRKIIDTMGKTPEQTVIIEETYNELESELTTRIAGLEKQIDQGINNRNHLIQANRAARTVMDVFNDILAKEKLDKRDISLIVERITVYENHIDIQLKADIDGLLATGVWEDPTTFPQDSKDIEPTTLVQSAAKRPDKVFTVNVISSGDPLEIYTDKEGGVIFKKYSLMEGLNDFAAQLCETLNRTTGRIAVITDRDNCIAVSGLPRRELLDKSISTQLEHIMEGRQIYHRKPADPLLPLCENESDLFLDIAAPILSEGDVFGCVVFVGKEAGQECTEVEYKLAQSIAGFLGRHMES